MKTTASVNQCDYPFKNKKVKFSTKYYCKNGFYFCQLFKKKTYMDGKALINKITPKC